MIRLPVCEEADVAVVRRAARELALGEGFSESRAGALVTAVSELARNIVVHAGRGEVLVDVVTDGARRGLLVIARDAAQGIPDVDEAMLDGFSTSRGLGLGLPSARRLVDEFTLTSAPGRGTTVVLRQWRNSPTT